MRLWTYVTQALFTSTGLDKQAATTTNLDRSSSMASKSNDTVYFGYGSNLWQHQMEQRCPTSKYLGIARLNNFRWIINERGYANVVELSKHPNETASVADAASTPTAYEDEVWGLVYTLYTTDEERLDRNEGVPVAYTKEMLECDYWHAPANTSSEAEEKKMLVYINRDQVEPDEPKEEYVYRMNQGIKDALKEGVPKEYVRKVIRPLIPELKDERIERVAREQALEFEDER